MSGEGEFEFIARRLAPLSQGAPGAACLKDDGALIDLDPGETLAVTTDTLIEGRHFPQGGDAGLAAQKALRVNLSDLAAMGARPFAYALNLVWPEGGERSATDAFVEGLAADQDRFAVRLIGGDTTSGPGPWTLAVTAFGRRPAGLALRRSAARPGDALVVTGTVGDAGLGLKVMSGEALGLSAKDCAWLTERSRRPSPRLEAINALRRHARAAIDVSDGLLADCRHLAEQSDLALTLDLAATPLSAPARRWLERQPDPAEASLAIGAAGDDYELLISTERPAALIDELGAAGLPAVQIGGFDEGEAHVDVQFKGVSLRPEAWGFTHF